MVANVTPPPEKEGAEVNGAKEARGRSQSMATLVEVGPHSI